MWLDLSVCLVVSMVSSNQTFSTEVSSLILSDKFRRYITYTNIIKQTFSKVLKISIVYKKEYK